MSKYIPIFLLIIVVGLSACAQDPWKADQIKAQAEADQLAAQSLQESMNEEMQRKFAADQHAIAMEDAQRKQARKDAVEQDIRNGLHVFIYATFLVGIVVLTYAIFTTGRQAVTQINRVQEGFANALITAVDIRSRLIPLNPNTRQYDLLLTHVHGTKYALHNPNDGSVTMLDQAKEGDAQKIAGYVAVQHSGLLAMEARKSGAKDAASISLIQKPPIIEGTALDIKTVAQDLTRKGWDDE